jgi:hypothetical protein
MDYYSHEPNSLLNYRVKCLEKDMRALKRRYEYMVRALMQRVIPKEEWDEWIAEYMGDMED